MRKTAFFATILFLGAGISSERAWSVQTGPPHAFSGYVIHDYGAFGEPTKNIPRETGDLTKVYVEQSRPFFSSCQFARDGAVSAQAMSSDAADIVLFSGHGSPYGPWVPGQSFDPSHGLRCKWFITSACSVLADGVTWNGQTHVWSGQPVGADFVNWDSGNLGLSRWKPAFSAGRLRGLMGYRSESVHYHYYGLSWFRVTTTGSADVLAGKLATYQRFMGAALAWERAACETQAQLHAQWWSWFVPRLRTGVEPASLFLKQNGVDYSQEVILGQPGASFPDPSAGSRREYTYRKYRYGNPRY